MTEMKIFVYGSMVEGLVHFDKIRDFVVGATKAKTRGTAYRLKVGYPVVVHDGESQIFGQLLRVKAPDLLVNLLDAFHGYLSSDETKSLYWRKEIEVHLEDGSIEKAWMYVLNPAKLPKNATIIPDGDWERSLKEKPAMTETLSERQKTYIQRLGATTGREIIPIDLPLYRELMNLEMIVDKGRRLALSKTGHEVFRYLT